MCTQPVISLETKKVECGESWLLYVRVSVHSCFPVLLCVYVHSVTLLFACVFVLCETLYCLSGILCVCVYRGLAIGLLDGLEPLAGWRCWD